MKAVVCETYGPPSALRVAERPSPSPSPRQVVVTVHAAAVNFPDTLIIEGKYQFKPTLPFSPGSEVAGVVKEVGAEVKHLRPGDKVAAVIGWGGYAQEVVADAQRVVLLPASAGPADLEIAASFLMAYGTSLHALQDRARLQAGETLLVLGAAGGVGLAAVELGKLMGARVIAAASSADKLEAGRRHGADEVIDYSRDDLREKIKEFTAGRGVDVVYDPVGGDFAEPALRSTGWNGRYLVVGFATGTIPKIPLNLPLLKGNAVLGVFWGEFVHREPERNAENVRRLFQWLAEGKIRPLISARYSLAQAPQALLDILARKVIGKIVILPHQVD